MHRLEVDRFSVKDLYPDWYRMADPGLDSYILNERWKTIYRLNQKNEADEWRRIVEVILNSTQDCIDALALQFREEDATFPLLNNTNLIQTLARILICYKLEGEKTAGGDFLAHGVLNHSFIYPNPFPPTSQPNIPVYRYARKYADRAISSSRDIVGEAIDINALNKLFESIKTDALISGEAVLDIWFWIRKLALTSNAVGEEVNVMWWLKNKWLTSVDKPFDEAGPILTALAAPKDLADLTFNDYGFRSAPHLLHTAISQAGKAAALEIDLLALILFFQKEVKMGLLLAEYPSSYAPFVPLLNILQYAFKNPSADVKKWIQEKFHLSPAITYRLYELSYQLYTEHLFLKKF